MTNFLGNKYRLESNGNFDDYLKALGVSVILRKLANTVTLNIQLLQKDETFTLRITSTFKDKDMVFRVGEEFDHTTEDGRKVKSTVTVLDKDRMVQTAEDPTVEGQKTTIVRTFSDTEVVAVLTYKDVSATRTFKRIK